MESGDLKIFQAVARKGSISKAAERGNRNRNRTRRPVSFTACRSHHQPGAELEDC